MKVNSSYIFYLFLLSGSVNATTAYMKPVYPPEALGNCIEGYVVISFFIIDGILDENISVLESKPVGVFEEAVIKNIKRNHNVYLLEAQEKQINEFSERFTFEIAAECMPSGR